MGATLTAGLTADAGWVGQKWAHFAGANRLTTGIVMMLFGLALVGVAYLLGG